MTAKLLIVFVCAAVGAATGYFVMSAYNRNRLYMESVCAMIAELKRNISYRRDSVAGILGGFETESPQLKKNIAEYSAYAAAKDGELVISRGFLSANDHAKVKELFGSLGVSDGRSQTEGLEAFAAEFDALKKAAIERSEKYGTLAVKLGFLFGLGVGVLFL